MCSKYVGDYTKHSNQELYKIFNGAKENGLCGIFTPQQLSYTYTNKTKGPISFFSSLIISGILFVSRNAAAQTEIVPDTIVENKIPTNDSTFVAQENNDTLNKQLRDSSLIINEPPQNESSIVEMLKTSFSNINHERLTLGFSTMKPIPSPYENALESAKNLFTSTFVLIGWKKTSQERPKKNPSNNSDKPIWFKEFKSRLRRKKRNK